MDECFTTMENSYLKVELDIQGSIIAFETTMPEFAQMQDRWMGKNWFDTCISQSDEPMIRKEYSHLFEDNYSEIIRLQHDVLTPEGKHLYMTFDPILKVDGAKKSLVLMGGEYYLDTKIAHWYCPNISKIDDIYFIA